MTAFPTMVRVEVTGDHELTVAFGDGAIRRVDMTEHHWNGVFEPLRDPAYFALAFLDPEGETVAWPNHVDLDPVVIYGCLPPLHAERIADPPDGPAPIHPLLRGRRS